MKQIDKVFLELGNLYEFGKQIKRYKLEKSKKPRHSLPLNEPTPRQTSK